MNVYLYNNTKRLNSTKAAPTAVDTLTCVLKDNCSFLNPHLRIKADTLPSFNYFKFENRYYRLTDLVSVCDGLWEVVGAVDPLTTFRGHVLNTNAFVLYDSTPNTQLPDNRLAIKTDCDAYIATAAMPWDFDSGTGTYLIATTGNTDETDFTTLTTVHGDRAGTGVYTIPQNQIDKLGFDISDFWTTLQQMGITYNQAISDIYTNRFSNLLNIGDVICGVGEIWLQNFDYTIKFVKLLASNIIGGGNALQNIKASYWLPFVLPSGTAGPLEDPQCTHTDHLALGNYTDVITGLKHVKKPVITSVTQNVTIPWHYSDWRNVACTEVMLYIPLIGCINIPAEVVKGNDTINVKISLNIFSGALAVEVLCDGAQIGTYGANCAMPILIGDSNINTGAIVNTLGSLATKNYVGAATSGIMSFNEMVSSVGGLGGGAGVGLSDQIICICRCHDTSQEPSALLSTIGTPTHQLKALSTGLGYVQCLNASVNCASVSGEPDPTQTEIEMINNYLNSGVYLE